MIEAQATAESKDPYFLLEIIWGWEEFVSKLISLLRMLRALESIAGVAILRLRGSALRSDRTPLRMTNRNGRPNRLRDSLHSGGPLQTLQVVLAASR